ncbi:MAG: rod shape-determining protein MreC [Peptostreptococcaceae bacterium]|nr:rod shape-determining protein MreC [Peptostreptococcaceae bacterium]
MKLPKNNKKTVALILSIMLLSIILLLSYKNFGGSSAAGGFIRQSVATVQGPLSKVSNGISNGLRGIFNFRYVVEENDKLKEENSILRKENALFLLNKAELEELRILSQALNYDGVPERNKVVAADVIAMDGSKWFNIFTINVGTESGIEKDDAVVNGVGLVGKIINSGEGWSKVIGIIDESNKVSFKVLRDDTLIGIVKGDGASGLVGFMLDGKASVIVGDILVTTNIGIYPQGIEIGKVSKVEFDNDTQLKNVTITPSVNFKNIQRVAVIL